MEQFSSQNKMPDLAPTWSVLDREPGMDDLAEGLTGVLEEMQNDLKIFPYQDMSGQDRLFLARFEFAKYGESSKFPEAVEGGQAAFIDFLAGFPIDCVEMLVFIGEISSKAKEGASSKVNVQLGTSVVPPVPSGSSSFFQWPEEGKILLNLTAIVTKNVGKIFAPNLTGEPKPSHVKWWFRVQLAGGEVKFPVPGEFGGLGVRMFPGFFWGRQKSSPFIYSGNYLNTIYYSGGWITEVIEPEEDGKFPWKTYKIKWQGEIVNVIPTDFAEYRGPIGDLHGDRVTILKDVSTEKTSQTWKDDDQRAATAVTGEGTEKTFVGPWQICPITFYGLEIEDGTTIE